MRGVDISHYQRGLTIRQIRDAGGAFAVIKLTEGDWLVDVCAFDFYREAYELGYPVGGYCYSHAVTAEQARQEAAFLLKTINGFPMPCGIFLDVEEPKQLSLSREALLAVVLAWCETISAAGYAPGVYGSEYNLWAKIKPDELPEDVLVWVAHYGRAPEIPCDLWQTGDNGRIPGYGGPVDTDEVRSGRFAALAEKGFDRNDSHSEKPKESAAAPDPIVMQLQSCLRWEGLWPEEIDGLRSEKFRERLIEYARGGKS